MNNNEEEFIKRVAQSTFDRLMRSQPHFDKVVELIKSQSKSEEEQQRWVSVEKRLPEIDAKYPACNAHQKWRGEVWFIDGKFQATAVTHWLEYPPLPAPPTAPKEGSQTKEEKQ